MSLSKLVAGGDEFLYEIPQVQFPPSCSAMQKSLDGKKRKKKNLAFVFPS